MEIKETKIISYGWTHYFSNLVCPNCQDKAIYETEGHRIHEGKIMKIEFFCSECCTKFTHEEKIK